MHFVLEQARKIQIHALTLRKILFLFHFALMTGYLVLPNLGTRNLSPLLQNDRLKRVSK